MTEIDCSMELKANTKKFDGNVAKHDGIMK
jgi:hypothetical protein